MGLRNGIPLKIRKLYIRIGNKFDGVEGIRDGNSLGIQKKLIGFGNNFFNWMEGVRRWF